MGSTKSTELSGEESPCSPEVNASVAANVVFLGGSLSNKLALVQRYAVERGPSTLQELQPNAMGTVERVERAISGACVSVAGQSHAAGGQACSYGPVANTCTSPPVRWRYPRRPVSEDSQELQVTA